MFRISLNCEIKTTPINKIGMIGFITNLRLKNGNNAKIINNDTVRNTDFIPIIPEDIEFAQNESAKETNITIKSFVLFVRGR